MTATLRRVRTTAHRDDPRPDSALVGTFVESGDPTAFAALVARHGPLVLGVCRRALGATADADDAFQATFLVLIRKAGAVPWRGSLGPWLFGVAHRIARKARFQRDRRFAVEKQVDAMPHPESLPPDPAEADELHRAFDEELAALPEAMREAVVLCELQGVGRAAAAKRLRITEGTLSSRLARARKALKDRLARRGFALLIPATAVVSARLAAATVGLANEAVGVVPAAVLELSQEAMKAMTISKLKLGAALVMVTVALSGFGLSAQGGPDDKPPAKAKAEPPAKAVAAKPAGPVATVGGDDISRAEFAEYLIRKYGTKEIEGFVNKMVIQRAAADKGVTVTGEELEAAILADLDALSMTREEFVSQVLARQGKTEAEWREDVLLPRLMMQKLCETTAERTVTDEYLRNLHERLYGEQRMIQLAFWPKRFGAKDVRERYERAKKDAQAFELYGITESTAASGGLGQRVITINRSNFLGGKKVQDAAFALKPEQISDLIETPEGWYAVKLVSIVPAQTDKQFDDVKDELKRRAVQEKLEQAVPALFAKLKEQAKPVYHIQPEPKAQPTPKK